MLVAELFVLKSDQSNLYIIVNNTLSIY